MFESHEIPSFDGGAEEEKPIIDEAEGRLIDPKQRQKFEDVFGELKAVGERLEKQATHDKLTGLYNRHGFEERWPEVFSLLHTDSLPQRKEGQVERMAVAVIDIDDFKSINDTYGHGAGDRALQEVANVLKKAFRANDLIVRFGGDEITLICPGTSAEELKTKISGLNFAVEHEGEIIPIFISVGIEMYNTKDDEETIGAVMERADQALRNAKTMGKGRVSIYEKPEVEPGV